MERANPWGLLALAAITLWSSAAFAITDAQKCEALKLKRAGQYNLCRLKAEAKAVKTGDPVDYSSCDLKFSTKWAAADSTPMCPTSGDAANVAAQVTADADFIALKLTGVRFVDNGDGTVTDTETGLQWEQKTDPCPAGYSATGSYSTTSPLVTTGTFTMQVDAGGTTWTGTATNSSLGPTNNCGGTLTGTTFSGTCYSGSIPLTGTVNCAPGTVSVTLSGVYTGSGSGTVIRSDIHDQYNIYDWSATGTAPDGAAFTTFLGTLNHATTDDPSTVTGCFADHCDWRLPTIAELQTILLAPYPCGTSPCSDPILGATQPDFYWSSTTTEYGFPSDAYYAWIVLFNNGATSGVTKLSPPINVYIRAVRGGL